MYRVPVCAIVVSEMLEPLIVGCGRQAKKTYFPNSLLVHLSYFVWAFVGQSGLRRELLGTRKGGRDAKEEEALFPTSLHLLTGSKEHHVELAFKVKRVIPNYSFIEHHINDYSRKRIKSALQLIIFVKVLQN